MATCNNIIATDKNIFAGGKPFLSVDKRSLSGDNFDLPIDYECSSKPALAFPAFFYYFLRMTRRLKAYTALLFLLLFSLLANSQSVYKTPSGKKYHLGTCHMVRNVSEKITPEQAIGLGLEPCKLCKPDLNQLKLSAENKAVGKSASVQCKGLTKKGARCLHKTHIANGYCYQHQPN
jgi:hypothetical protein